MNKNNSASLEANNSNLFLTALNYEIPENWIETIKDSKNPNAKPLSYLSWSYAWATFKQIYPDATYEIVKNPDTHLPYFYDPQAGIMVETRITANGETHQMWLFVMDGTNQAMRLEPYEYQKFNSYTKTWEPKGVKAATMFDINKTLLRCLVKNMAIFGFGLKLYAGQDLPKANFDGEPKAPQYRIQSNSQPVQADPYAGIKKEICGATDVTTLMTIYLDHQNEIEGNPSVKALLTQRKVELKSAA